MTFYTKQGAKFYDCEVYPQPFTVALLHHALAFSAMKVNDRRAQITLYCEPAWNRFHNHISYALFHQIELNNQTGN